MVPEASWSGWPWDWTSIIEGSLNDGIRSGVIEVQEGGDPASLVEPIARDVHHFIKVWSKEQGRVANIKAAVQNALRVQMN